MNIGNSASPASPAKQTGIRIGIKKLLQQAVRAIVSPRRAFSVLAEGEIAYGEVIPFLAVAGIAWIHLHGYLLFTEPIWINWQRWLLYSLTFALFPIISWSHLSLIAWFAHNWIKKSQNLPLARVEQAVFALIFLWLLLPIFDIAHLYKCDVGSFDAFSHCLSARTFLDVPLVQLPFVGAHPVHLSHIVAAIFIPVELFYLFSQTFAFTRALALTLALIALPVAKFLFEDLGFLIEEAFFRAGFISGKYDDSVFGFFSALPAVAVYFIIRGFKMRWPRKYVGGAVGGALLFYGAIGALTLPSLDPLYPGYASDAGMLDSSRDRIPKKKDFVFADTINFSSPVVLASTREVHCIVRFQNDTRTREGGDAGSFARCDIAPGPEKGANQEFFLGEEWKDIKRSSERITVFKDPRILQTLTHRNNDIRVHVETAPGDRISFSGVFIELK